MEELMNFLKELQYLFHRVNLVTHDKEDEKV